MSKYKIVISDYYYENQDEENEIYRKLGEDVEIIDCTKIVPGGLKTSAELKPYVKDCDALVIQFAKLDRDLLSSMEKCRVISKYSIGVDTIDVQAATDCGIWVSNVPDYCIDEAADTACAHILNAARKLSKAEKMLRKKAFSMEALQPVKRLSACTLGMIGFGRIAQNAAKKLFPFVKEIRVSDPYFSGQEDWADIIFCGKEEVFENADILALFVPLTEETYHLLDREAFAKMKDGVIIVNTARGDLVSEEALTEALDSGKVSFAGLDLIEGSEDFEHSPLLHRDDVLVTPHIAWLSREAQRELQRKTAENVITALQTGTPVYPVNGIGKTDGRE